MVELNELNPLVIFFILFLVWYSKEGTIKRVAFIVCMFYHITMLNPHVDDTQTFDCLNAVNIHR